MNYSGEQSLFVALSLSCCISHFEIEANEWNCWYWNSIQTATLADVDDAVQNEKKKIENEIAPLLFHFTAQLPRLPFTFQAAATEAAHMPSRQRM